jgi:multiple sugar transport system permease protein
MVFLQQMKWASQPVQFAAFVLASIPTLIVFVSCQRVIMRGIILPTEK